MRGPYKVPGWLTVLASEVVNVLFSLVRFARTGRRKIGHSRLYRTLARGHSAYLSPRTAGESYMAKINSLLTWDYLICKYSGPT